LMILDRLSEAVKEEPDRNKIKEIHEDMLRFSNRYWFPEISNHLQARELFQLWSEQLGAQKLFERVNGELQKVKDYLDIESGKKLNDVITRLTTVAALAASLALTTSLLPVRTQGFPRFFIILLITLFTVFSVGYYLLPAVVKRRLGLLLVLLLIILVVPWLSYYYCETLDGLMNFSQLLSYLKNYFQ